MFDFDFVFILLFTLYFPIITFLNLLFYYHLFLFTVFCLDFNKFFDQVKFLFLLFLTVSHQPRSWGTFKNVWLYSFWSSGSSLSSSLVLFTVIKIFWWSWRVTTDLPLPFTSESFLSVIFQNYKFIFRDRDSNPKQYEWQPELLTIRPTLTFSYKGMRGPVGEYTK